MPASAAPERLLGCDRCSDGDVDRPLLPTGIAGPNRSGGIIQDPTPETIEIWRSVFDVNVLGSINILKAFVPGLVEAGPLRSGKRTVVVTTSSSLGLYNMMPGPCKLQLSMLSLVCKFFSRSQDIFARR